MVIIKTFVISGQVLQGGSLDNLNNLIPSNFMPFTAICKADEKIVELVYCDCVICMIQNATAV